MGIPLALRPTISGSKSPIPTDAYPVHEQLRRAALRSLTQTVQASSGRVEAAVSGSDGFNQLRHASMGLDSCISGKTGLLLCSLVNLGKDASVRGVLTGK